MTAHTAETMRQAIWRHYAARAAVLIEVSTDAQPEMTQQGAGALIQLSRRRQIDVLTVSRARKHGIGPLDLLAFEIKVSRSDFFADVKEPAKQARWRDVAHRHAYAVPVGLVRPGEVPAGSGLLTVGEQWRGIAQYDVNWAVRAPYSESPDLPSWLTLALAYRMSAAEAKLRGLTSETRDMAGGTVEDLRGALVESRRRAALLAEQLERSRTECSEWKRAFAAQGHLPCAHCQKPVRPKSVRRGHFTDWIHVSRADEAPCGQIRRAIDRWTQVEPADGIAVPEVAS